MTLFQYLLFGLVIGLLLCVLLDYLVVSYKKRKKEAEIDKHLAELEAVIMRDRKEAGAAWAEFRRGMEK